MSVRVDPGARWTRPRWVDRAAAVALVVSAILAGATSAAGQEVSGGVEIRRDRLEYHFDNPSRFDTPGLVPHFFEQRYDADNVWLTLTARYGRGQRFETTVGVTPRRGTTADDYDTFLDPGGPVWVSGTTGPADVRSVSFEQLVAIAGGASRSQERRDNGDGRYTVSVGYRLRRDAFDFGVGHKTVTRDGALVAATDVTSGESATSQLHQFFAAIDLARDVNPGWRIAARGEIAPLAIGRLAVQLPDKYPGQDLVFVARAFGASGRVEIARRFAAWHVVVAADAGRTWSYRSSDAVHLTTAGASLSVARRW